ncbi:MULTISPECIES: hypothetical protein [unclassified Rhodococcus (in: high G+C Gram-positive bacteria)]|uniref:hypothetical protein n=1 Tax=unclassified Rhodococcus (in: high G+C Gram-positive bacteria) TaxID=192944 RepID=UPI0006F7B6D3|nr:MULTISPECIES: hypothetical protein [unclassified Rhodococcus (in: high G+C Gram-positive bacteria)]KQU36115.1 hypothetical protein ASG69_17500 [Rhodococcus sp. Leaf225]KQU48663.1 hypothetical protein ASH03_01975 [Rhodococcus sp. Leaf258]
MDLDASRLVLRQNALQDGYTDNELRRLYTRGDITRLGHGAYLDATRLDGLNRVEKHRVLLEAVMPALSSGAVMSHQTAALMHGWPLWAVDLTRVHVTRDRRNGGRRRADTMVHCAPLPGSAVHVVNGFTVTSPARTLVDVARTVPFEQAVVMGDAAGIEGDSLVEELAVASRRHGIAGARRVAAFLDPLSGSVGESRSRVLFHRVGLPPPVLQAGIGVWRVDFLWGDVIGEFDGRVKYGRFLRPGQDAGDAVFEEKRREDALRALGFRVVRWTWADLARPEALIARLRALL